MTDEKRPVTEGGPFGTEREAFFDALQHARIGDELEVHEPDCALGLDQECSCTPRLLRVGDDERR